MIRPLRAGLGFGRRRGQDIAEGGPAEPVPPRLFASYANPFDAGLDHPLTPDDLIIDSFEGLHSWADEHELAHSPHGTPMEFVKRIAKAGLRLGPDATRLVGYIVAIVYGHQGFRSEVLHSLRLFWRGLEGCGKPVAAESAREP